VAIRRWIGPMQPIVDWHGISLVLWQSLEVRSLLPLALGRELSINETRGEHVPYRSSSASKHLEQGSWHIRQIGHR
jgi:hypothetical protein